MNALGGIQQIALEYNLKRFVQKNDYDAKIISQIQR